MDKSKYQIDSLKTIFGEFNKQGIFIDVENNDTEFSVLSTIAHEMTHSFLVFDTYLGQIEFLCQQILTSPDVTPTVKACITKLKDKIYDTTIEVQESLAVYCELSFLEMFYPEKMDSELTKYKQERQDYYIDYGFIRLEDYLEDEFARYKQPLAQDDISLRAENMIRVGKACMNIDITKLGLAYDTIIDELGKDVNNANKRFDIVINYFKDKNINPLFVTEKQIDVMMNELGLEYISKFEKDIIVDWAEAFLKQYDLGKYSDYVVYDENVDPFEQILYINCYTPNSFYSGRCYYPKREELFSCCYYSYILDDDERYHSPVSFIDVNNKNIYYSGKREFDKNVAEKIGRIFTDRHTFVKYFEKEKIQTKAEMVIDIANWDFISARFIEKRNIEKYYLCKINSLFSMLVMKEKNLNFVLVMPSFNVELFTMYYLYSYDRTMNWWGKKSDLRDLVCFFTKKSISEVVIDD